VPATAIANAASFIRAVNGTQELNPGLGDQSTNLAKSQDLILPAQKTDQRTKVRNTSYLTFSFDSYSKFE